MKDQYDEQYASGLETFRKSVGNALQFHSQVRELPLQGVAPTARLMFARIFFMSASILRLCPPVENERAIWDFTSIAILARSLFEAIMFFRYFCEPSGADEWVARLALINLHDCCDRGRLFTELGRPDDVRGFAGEADELREVLRRNIFFQAFDEPKKRSLLNGYNAAFKTLREMGEKYAPAEPTWALYQFLSSYAHSYPVGYMRNSDNRRDGLENETDKVYIPGLLKWLAELLDAATKAFHQIPAGVSLTVD
ncbi:MAG: DUF5677 domain-containing protein [Acidobacteriaceae bacterium]